jgi:hypothetical protein
MKKALVAAAAATLGLAVFAGCSSDSSSSTSTTKAATSKDAVCSARTKLKNNLQSLEDPSLLTGGKSGISSALDGVEQDVNNLTDAAKTDYKPQVDAVKSAIASLKKAVANVGNGSLSSSLQDVSTAVSKVGSTTETLLNQVKAACPSS